MKRAVVAVAAAAMLGGCPAPQRGGGGSGVPAWVADTSSFAGARPATTVTHTISGVGAVQPSTILGQGHRDAAAKILAAARADRGAYTKLAYLTDRIGHRLSGSAGLDRAIVWAQQAMAADGHATRAERVMVPHWVRGREEAAVTAPVARPLRIIGLGGTVATSRGGVVAPLVVVRSWDELDAQPARVKGAIVLYDVAMPPWSDEHGSGYGTASAFRTGGPSRAAKHGAVGVLMRSATARSLSTPHTGAVHYDPAQPKIPAAAVTLEDAQYLGRLAAQGPVSVRLRLESRHLPDAPSANVIGELRGTEQPEEIVVLGAHLDSWDVGQGAHDDGAGCVMMMQALTVLRSLGLQPRRTIRVVLFTNEENGVRGGTAYAKDHAAELARTVLAIEADFGGFAPRGFNVEARPEVAPRVLARITEIAALLRPLGVTRVQAGHSGVDIGKMLPAGMPGIGLVTDGATYFDIHHTEADTLDKVDPAALADNVAAIAVLAYLAAELPGRLDAP